MVDFESDLPEVKEILANRLTNAITEITGRLDMMDRRFESMESNMNRMTEILARIEANQFSGKAERRVAAMEVFRDLPRELVEEEILTHVPAKYLKGLGSTCKLWNSLFTGDGRFGRKHFDKAAKQFVVLMLTKFCRICPAIVDLDGKVPTFEVKPELSLVDPQSKYPGAQFDVYRVVHCDGLLLCTCKDGSRFVVWNPLTGETRWFQPGSGGTVLRGFTLGYGKNKSYKILSYYRGFTLQYSSITASLQGSSYWFGIDATKPVTISCLVKFDFSTEKFVPVAIPYPSQPVCRFEVSRLTNVKDERLSLLVQVEETSKTEIWVTNKIDETNNQVVSWTKVLALDLSPHNDVQVSDDGSFVFVEEKKVVVISETWIDFEAEDENDVPSKEMIYIAGEDNVVTQVDFGPDEANPCVSGIFHYVPSLVQMEQAGGKRKRAEISEH
ncbi:unnamed protein product [Microthlaspi erraticum]|uniref:F-box associated beta-propeller type 1 domain-containing protein n=1 Tax=Microthlaspi erraticum TaxID=1685480 RepID=A0A6D2JVQ6_9BRAS|nr:unnamed protein product [Microthlaspi erraticum]CAA7057863.1 unnamed protein product [Microthlaspi erraticum]